MLNHTGTIQIETERLILRKFVYEDIPNILKNWIANPAVQNEYGESEYKTATEVHKLLSRWIALYKNNDFYRWAILLKKNNENIGQIAFCKVYTEIETAEIEYCIGENYWEKGYATEALNAVIEFSFKGPKFYKLEAFHRIANSRSGRVLKKTIMREVETVRRFELENIKPDDDICYSIINDDYHDIQA